MRRFFAPSVAVMALIGTTSAAFALKDKAFQGKPTKFEVGKLQTAVWHDDDGQHVRFSTAGKVVRKYTGKVCAEKIEKADGFELEDGDTLTIGADGVCLNFDFTTDGAVDGFDFRAAGAGVTYELLIDGKPIPKKDILIGADNVHPKMQPFVLNRM